MNASQLLCCINCDPVLYERVNGVYPADHLPRSVKSGGLIANTDSSDKPGEHWCAFYFVGDGRAEFFDSYGRSPSFYDSRFTECLRDNSRTWSYNTELLQNEISDVCGQFCLYFLIHRLRGRSMVDIVRQFDKLDFNDQYVYDTFSKYFHVVTSISVYITRHAYPI